jgi:hypothetical protein
MTASGMPSSVVRYLNLCPRRLLWHRYSHWDYLRFFPSAVAARWQAPLPAILPVFTGVERVPRVDDQLVPPLPARLYGFHYVAPDVGANPLGPFIVDVTYGLPIYFSLRISVTHSAFVAFIPDASEHCQVFVFEDTVGVSVRQVPHFVDAPSSVVIVSVNSPDNPGLLLPLSVSFRVPA